MTYNKDTFNTMPWSPWDDVLNKAIIASVGEVVNEGMGESSEDIWDLLLRLQVPYMDDDWLSELNDVIEGIEEPRERIKAKIEHFSRANQIHDWLIHVTHVGGQGAAIDKAWEMDRARREKK